MKFVIAILILFSSSQSVVAQENIGGFELKGTLNGKNDGMLYLYYSGTGNARVKDSVNIKERKFSFNGKTEGPGMATLQLKEEKRNGNNTVMFFLEPSVMNVVLSFKNFREAKFTGSKTQETFGVLQSKKWEISKRWKVVMDTLSEVNKRSNTQYQELKDWVLQPYFAEMEALDLKFFDDHPQSFATAYMLRFYVSKFTLDSLLMYYDRLGGSLQQSNFGKDLADEIQKLRAGSPGSIAADFTATDINGKQLNLSDFKGKYILLDFWASWCVPCRKGNPHLKELYAKYKAQGIEFIGVSDDDRNHEAWKKAVDKDGLPWRHVLRGLDMEKRIKNEPNPNDISEKFGISTLPTKILIDPNGKIIGRYGEEEKALDAQLKEIFGN